MLNITVFVKNDEYVGIRSEGHAGYGEAGEDIVCAAVSVLMINTVNAIETFTEDTFEGEEHDGFLEFHLTETISAETRVLMKALVLGLTDIQKSYGSSYLEIATKEV